MVLFGLKTLSKKIFLGYFYPPTLSMHKKLGQNGPYRGLQRGGHKTPRDVFERVRLVGLILLVSFLCYQITAAAMTSEGKTLILAESSKVYVWNFPYRAILSCNHEPNVVQILFTADEKRYMYVYRYTLFRIHFGNFSLLD